MKEIRALIDAKASFAVLTPLTLVPEISRLENDKEGNIRYDKNIAAAVNKLCKVVRIFASSAQCWLISCPGMTTESTILLAEQGSKPATSAQQNVVGRTIYLAEHQEGCSEAECLRIASDSEANFKELVDARWDWNAQRRGLSSNQSTSSSRERVRGHF